MAPKPPTLGGGSLGRKNFFRSGQLTGQLGKLDNRQRFGAPRGVDAGRLRRRSQDVRRTTEARAERVRERLSSLSERRPHDDVKAPLVGDGDARRAKDAQTDNRGLDLGRRAEG